MWNIYEKGTWGYSPRRNSTNWCLLNSDLCLKFIDNFLLLWIFDSKSLWDDMSKGFNLWEIDGSYCYKIDVGFFILTDKSTFFFSGNLNFT